MIENLKYEQVEAIADSLRSLASQLQNTFDRVDTEMNKVNTGEVWASQAAAAAHAQFMTLSQQFPNFVALIRNYSSFLNKTVDTYRNADQKIESQAG